MSRYQKGKINLDFTEARGSEWQWHQLGHMQVCTSLQITTPAPHHSVFTGRMPFLPPNQQCQSTGANRSEITVIFASTTNYTGHFFQHCYVRYLNTEIQIQDCTPTAGTASVRHSSKSSTSLSLTLSSSQISRISTGECLSACNATYTEPRASHNTQPEPMHSSCS